MCLEVYISLSTKVNSIPISTSTKISALFDYIQTVNTRSIIKVCVITSVAPIIKNRSSYVCAAVYVRTVKSIKRSTTVTAYSYVSSKRFYARNSLRSVRSNIVTTTRTAWTNPFTARVNYIRTTY